MKEELQGKLVEILTSIQAAAGKASDFAMEQLPDVAQSYVVYGRVSSVLIVAALVAVAIGCGLLSRYFWKNPSYSNYSWDKDKNVRSSESWAAVNVSALGCVVFAGFSVVATVNGALVWFAPKVWLLKEIAALVK